MSLPGTVLSYIRQHEEEAFDLLLKLARIPAPSNHEEKRAAFCREWLEKQGAQGVYIDSALNVIYPVGDLAGPLTVFMAHSDVVFPDTEELPLKVENGKIFCPGIGDNTANAAALLMAAKYIASHNPVPKEGGLLLVIDAGEEGLGNLKGSRQIMEAFGNRVKEVICLDGTCRSCVNAAVGSNRYRIGISTEGGHSYSKFGNRNAIAYLASMITELYTIKVPEGGKTTFNVGTIQGGTSVNSIAQHAEMLYEFRSDDRASLKIMERHLNAVLELYRAKGVKVHAELIGERPCTGDVSPEAEQALMDRAATAVREHFSAELKFTPGSTDCNIPLSMGIPSIELGCYEGGGSHTREEYVEIDSLLPGLNLAFDLVLGYCSNISDGDVC